MAYMYLSEMFFTQFSTFFCANDSDEDEYYMYHDSSDDNTYYQSAVCMSRSFQYFQCLSFHK